MVFNNLGVKYSHIDLEIEAIQRFRRIVPFVSPDCHVFRELEKNSTILCLDFAACPQELNMSRLNGRDGESFWYIHLII